MKTIITGILVFTAWAIFSNYWYVCKIKNLCNEETEVVVADVDINERTASAPEETSELESESANAALVEEIEETVIYFAFDSSYVLNDRMLQDMVGDVMALKPQHIVLEGHTCNIGPESYNYRLGQRRAERVKEELVSQGMENQKINTKSFGENDPLVPNTSEDNREKNRRVEILITSNN